MKFTECRLSVAVFRGLSLHLPVADRPAVGYGHTGMFWIGGGRVARIAISVHRGQFTRVSNYEDQADYDTIHT